MGALDVTATHVLFQKPSLARKDVRVVDEEYEWLRFKEDSPLVPWMSSTPNSKEDARGRPVGGVISLHVASVLPARESLFKQPLSHPHVGPAQPPGFWA